MDYSYLNQAAGFDSSCLQGAGMDPTGLGNMPCSYGDITSCSQMSQAAYRYTAAAASMARSYNPGGSSGTMGVHHPGATATQCAVMGGRPHVQDVHRATMFPSSMNLQIRELCEYGTVIRKLQDSCLPRIFYRLDRNYGATEEGFRERWPDTQFPNRNYMVELAKKFEETGSVQDAKKISNIG
ncbi:helix-turn-helix domain [Holotrichia oblita]|uniref:Helix-turn-helix domain n=1 Tax=Holotrichia oblita TaxID=644536 RepID=A0ACB9T8Z3_HOLOL|nr:helix-turn-helix domain [Holotrichia oblita]